jgi:sarcosine oxidase, subunit gamma
MPDLSAARTATPLTENLWLRALAPACRWVLRGDEAVRAAAEAALGLSVPAQACRAGANGERAALWLGPDEWLLVAPTEQAGLATRLARALSELPHSLVEVSQRQLALLVHGPYAATLLASGCPLDLDPAAFPVGMCTRTMLGKAEVVLWRTDPESFRLEVWRSFAPYVTQFLSEAGRGIII